MTSREDGESMHSPLLLQKTRSHATMAPCHVNTLHADHDQQDKGVTSAALLQKTASSATELTWTGCVQTMTSRAEDESVTSPSLPQKAMSTANSWHTGWVQ